MCSDGNWRHSEGLEEVVTVLFVIRYTTAVRPSLRKKHKTNDDDDIEDKAGWFINTGIYNDYKLIKVIVNINNTCDSTKLE